MRARACLLACAAAIAALATSAPPAEGAIETATSGPLTAQLSYQAAGGGWKDAHITIIRNGAALLDYPPKPICSFCVIWPGGGGAGGAPSVHALHLDADPEPEAVFDFYTGGAHCCWYSLIFRYDPATNAYLGSKHRWFNTSYRFFDPDGDGIFEFLTRDDRFAYKYASYAGSRYPPQVWRFDGTELVDVSSQHPSVVHRSARGLRREYRGARGKSDVRGVLAALVADRCLLGDCSSGFQLVRQARRQGHLRKRLTEFGPSGRHFVRDLHAFLRRLGYL